MTPIPPRIQAVLDKSPTVFETPKELPPTRSRDHLILIIEGSKPVNLNMYNVLACNIWKYKK